MDRIADSKDKMDRIRIILGDITAADVDAIVNAANPVMLGGGGVDGAIHRAAGPSLVEACRRVPAHGGVRCPFGEARITEAGNLNARYVIHAVGPIYRREREPGRVLRSAYEQACHLALTHQCRSIAFPAISCGAYGYPHREAAEIALSTCGSKAFSALEVSFYVIERKLYDLFCEILDDVCPGDG